MGVDPPRLVFDIVIVVVVIVIGGVVLAVVEVSSSSLPILNALKVTIIITANLY